MLSDLLDELIHAAEHGTKNDVERVCRKLERLGVDRRTAVVMVRARENERREKK